jgi:hypothetical protein
VFAEKPSPASRTTTVFRVFGAIGKEREKSRGKREEKRREKRGKKTNWR